MSEYANRIITCENIEDGVSITFNERETNPFILAKAEGIYDAQNNVYVSDNVMIDGAEYQSSVMKTRNIVLNIKDVDNFSDNRSFIDAVFAKGKVVRLTAIDDTHTRIIDCYTEFVKSTATPKSRITTISLLSPDPYFYDKYASHAWLRNVMDGFEFIHEFVAEGEEFSYYNLNRIYTILNETAENNVGLTIEMTSSGTVVNPSIVKINTGEKIQVGYTEKPFTLGVGEKLIVTTTTGKKNIVWEHGGITEDINHYLSNDSTFFQLMRGRNTFGYNADSGADYLTIHIIYRFKYMRA